MIVGIGVSRFEFGGLLLTDYILVTGDHVVHLPPLGRGHTPPIRAASFVVALASLFPPPLADAAIPDDMQAEIIAKRTRKQFKRREVPAANDHESWIGNHHSSRPQLTVSVDLAPQTALDRYQSSSTIAQSA